MTKNPDSHRNKDVGTNCFIDPIGKAARKARVRAEEKRARLLAGPVISTFVKPKEQGIMAVSLKTIKTKDMNAGGKKPRKREVHYIKLNKSNLKGSAETIGGILHADDDIPWIELEMTVNRKKKSGMLIPGDIVFRTDNHDRWQALGKRSFAKRFPEAKI